MAFKIYTNRDEERYKENAYLLISDGERNGSLCGCAIRTSNNNYGYGISWRKDFFKEVDEMDAQVPMKDLIDGRYLYIESGSDTKSCIIDLKDQKMITNRERIKEILPEPKDEPMLTIKFKTK